VQLQGAPVVARARLGVGEASLPAQPSLVKSRDARRQPLLLLARALRGAGRYHLLRQQIE
jgi:hypothetical protein